MGMKPSSREKNKNNGGNEFDLFCKFHDYNFKKYKGSQRVDKIARNLVDYEAGKTIFATALNIHLESNSEQPSLF